MTGAGDLHEIDQALQFFGEMVGLQDRLVMRDAVPEYPDPLDLTMEGPTICCALEAPSEVGALPCLHIIDCHAITTAARPQGA
jgi:hypothetical protein